MNTIQQGSKGPDVQRWQGIIGITADGDFGPQTDVATRAFQLAHGLTADGVVGPQTWAAAGLAPEYTGTGTRVAQGTSTPVAVKKPAASNVSISTVKPTFLQTVESKLPSFPVLLAVGLVGVGFAAAIYKASK